MKLLAPDISTQAQTAIAEANSFIDGQKDASLTQDQVDEVKTIMAAITPEIMNGTLDARRCDGVSGKREGCGCVQKMRCSRGFSRRVLPQRFVTSLTLTERDLLLKTIDYIQSKTDKTYKQV